MNPLITIVLVSCLWSCSAEELPMNPVLTVAENPSKDWTGPRIVFEREGNHSQTSFRNRPMLVKDWIYQISMPSSGSATAWEGLVRYEITSDRTDTVFSGLADASYYAIRPDNSNRIVYKLAGPLRVVDCNEGVLLHDVPKDQSRGSFTRSQSGDLTLVARPVVNDTFHEINRVNLTDLSEEPWFRIPAGPKGAFPSLRNLFVRQVDGHNWAIGEVDFYDHHLDRAPCFAFAYDIDAGELKWANLFPVEKQHSNAQKVIADDDHVYQKSWNRVVAWNLRTGVEEWRTDITEKQIAQSPMMVGGGRVYFVGDNSGTYGLDAATGERTFYTEDVGGTVVGIEPYRGKYLVLSMYSSKIHLFDPERGVYEWGFKSPHHNTDISRQWFVDNFSIDEERGLLTAHDYHGLYVFDIEDWE